MTSHIVKQTLCPYTTIELSKIELVNKEHILPVSLGAPYSFYVSASAEENSRMADLIDTPAGNDPLLRFMAMATGVTSRSGPVTVTIPGEVTGTNDPITVEFSSDGITPKFRLPVVKGQNGEIAGVNGFGNDAIKLAEQVQKNYARKGKQVDIGDPVSSGNPWLGLRMSLNTSVLRQELIKICYLMTVRVFGDAAILSNGGSLFRAAIECKDAAQLTAIGIQGSTFNGLPTIFPKPSHGKHIVGCIQMGDSIHTGVSLFGCFDAFFTTTVRNSPPILGEIIEIDIANKSLHSYSNDEMLQLMVTAAAGMQSGLIMHNGA